MAKDLIPTTQSPAQEKHTPTIYIDLTKSDIGELKGLQVNDKVRVVITGKVLSIAMHQGKTGSISVESKDVVIRDAPGGEMEKLMDEDD